MLDSNLIIYSARPEYSELRRFLESYPLAASAISLVEVLGYHRITPTESSYFETFFSTTEILPLTDAVVMRAVSLRQIRKMSLGDALIAATALESSRELLTHNIKDFENIPGLIVTDPLAS